MKPRPSFDAEPNVISSKTESFFADGKLRFRQTVTTRRGEQTYVFDATAFAAHAHGVCASLEIVKLPARGVAA